MLAVVLSVGIASRLVAFSRSAVEHFDEGVYASNIYFPPPDYAYPQQRFFAPPLLPALIEAGMIAGFPPNVAALLPSLLAGCATVAAIWWVGRSWFGPEVGLSAATLVALNDFHVAYSATALTDVLLGLWLILALDAVARSLTQTDFRWSIAAGIFTGLAWWTKYNGWLPLAIEAVALPLLYLLLRPASKQLLTWCASAAVTAIVAIGVWCPYFFSLQSVGGYGPIAENHARYFVGLPGWLDAASRQIANQYGMETLLSAAAVAAALALPGLLHTEEAWDRIWRGGICVAVGFLAIFWSCAVVAGVGAMIGIARLLLARHQETTSPFWRQMMIGFGILTVWWAGLVLATPCYTPYPRLFLPLLLASSLGFGLNAAESVDDISFWPGGWEHARHSRIFGIAILIALFAVPAIFFPHEHHLLQSHQRRGLVHIAKQIRDAAANHESRVFYVFGEPALFFQLRAAGEPFVAPVQDVPKQVATLNDRAVPTYLIVGPHAQTDPQFKQQWSSVEDSWQLLEAFDYTPSAVVWLDLHDPRRPIEALAGHSIRLHQLRD